MACAKKAPAKSQPGVAPVPEQHATTSRTSTSSPKAAAVPASSSPEPATASTSKKAAAPVKKAAPTATSRPSSGPELPPVKGVTKDGIAFTKDFDAKFLTAQRALLLEEREALTGQALRLEDEANSLIEEGEMGDVQFDDEGGEGDTMVVERERDLALSAQARQTIADIDAALERLKLGTYGYSVESGVPIDRERLEAIPWATVLVSEKVGGIGRR